MHANDARKAGETEQRLQALCVWQETPYFTPREAAALAGPGNSPASVRVRCRMLDELREHFDDKEIAELTLAVSAVTPGTASASAWAWPE